MTKISKVAEYVFDYLSINGKALTPNTTNLGSGSITGPITATTFCDWLALEGMRELALNFNITAVSGTSPTLTIKLLFLDPLEPTIAALLTLTLNATAISAASQVRFVISRSGVATVWIAGTATSLGNITVPMMCQAQLVVGGTTPSFSIIGSYEARS